MLVPWYRLQVHNMCASLSLFLLLPYPPYEAYYYIFRSLLRFAQSRSASATSAEAGLPLTSRVSTCVFSNSELERILFQLY